jgi:hypothetical protein
MESALETPSGLGEGEAPFEIERIEGPKR